MAMDRSFSRGGSRGGGRGGVHSRLSLPSGGGVHSRLGGRGGGRESFLDSNQLL